MSERAELPHIEIGSPLLHDAGDVLDVGIVRIGPDFAVRGWNRWLEQASGRSSDEVVGRSLLELFPELVGTNAESAFRRALGGGTVVLSHRLHRYLLPLPAPTGVGGYARMQQSARIVPVLRDDLRVDGAVAFIEDVTERVASEEELRAATRRAEEASQAKSDFLASMSHELRTPLTAVVGYAELLALQVSGPLGPVQLEYVDRIKQCSRHLLQLVQEVLSFARTEAGKEVLQLSETDAAQIVRDAVVLLEPQAAQKSLVLDVRVPTGPVPMLTDVTKARQILVNVIGNAIKFTDCGSVTVELFEGDDAVLFEVSDTGPGIPSAQREHIFEAFTQLDQSRTREKGGAGLGLPLSRNLAQLLGGSLEVDSVVGTGSCFTIRLARRATQPSAPTLGD